MCGCCEAVEVLSMTAVALNEFFVKVNVCIAGYGKGKTSSNFDYAGPLTETVLFANLALRSWNL